MPWPDTRTAVCERERLRHHQPLPRADHRAGEMVPLTDLPDAFPRIATVVVGSDLPERVVGLDDVRPGFLRPARRPRKDDPRHEEGENEAGHTHEHMYA